MDILGSLAIALAMYSRIPVPQVTWNPKRMQYALCFFPFIGVIIGAALIGLKWLSSTFGISGLTFACFAAVLPLLITGGIHMDGYLDTIDAVSSRQEREQKLAILKDPHAGAFAIIYGGIYLICTVGLFYELDFRTAVRYGSGYVLSRAVSAWVLVSWPKAKKDGLAQTFSTMADRRRVGMAMAGWCLAVWFWLYATGGAVSGIFAGAAVFTALLKYDRVKREFGGVTGDLAGYFLQLCELYLLAAFVLLDKFY